MAVSTETTTNGDNTTYDVTVVGGGPSGLMLSTVLARLGHNIKILEHRPDQTTVGRADGIQPKSIETLQMLRLGDELLQTGVKVYDICMWRGAKGEGPKRMSREVHYPESVVDLKHPYILLCHQGMVESMLIDDLRASGTEVTRNAHFVNYTQAQQVKNQPLQITFTDPDKKEHSVISEYLVGCDGARSLVREAIPDTFADGTPHSSVWGVMDGELETTFPDIWSKTLVYSEEYGSILMIPRERNMTRFYIEMKGTAAADDTGASNNYLGQEYVMEQARKILSPYKVEWRSVEWFGNYAVSQRVANRFSDPAQRAFIAGDASHSHSPKAAQGMNTSIHDSWNMGWKLNLALRGLAKPVLLNSYETERKKIAHDLINFDVEHANEVAAGDPKRLADNFRTNIRFISGVGAEYTCNEINQGSSIGLLKPGANLPPGKATRYVDANPVSLETDIPVLGQFRVYVVVPNLVSDAQKKFLQTFNDIVASESSLISRLSQSARKSYQNKPRAVRAKDTFFRPERYTTVSDVFTFSLITSTDKDKFEIDDLPQLFSQTPWTVYLDDVAHLDTQGKAVTQKWLGGLSNEDVAIINVRPDGYVGSVDKWDTSTDNAASAAANWISAYYDSFLQV
ncbi:hypothetical protein NW762_010143 [Fusarium torreyae]|uniref:FAD binding domain-containing protein n=1 Tax=Fusarium torreyae TaxID=1237075 RepID=A0A9W8RV32_9HYPO|nr:hypothetical protein NW762_010143 [Fusarium torreyae]